MDTIITSGRELLSSGIFSTFNDEPTVISVHKGSEGFNLTINFIEDSSNPESRLGNVKIEKDKEKNYVNVTLELININSTFFSGLSSPIAIGRFDNGDKVYLQINARKLGASLNRYEITYTVYVEGKK
jgi:hypothetical protein